MGLIKEFKEFISRGNVIDLAVGVIIGGAFTAIVNSLVNDIINPVISILTGGTDQVSGMSLLFNGVEIKFGSFVGAVISLLSFYMLMLSVYLLLQKNTTKLENLLLIGYRPALVALPYQLLTAGLNFVVLLLACAALCAVRGQYMQVLSRLFPQMESPSLLGTMGVGAAIFLAVSLINCLAIRRKINSIRLHRG